ncbi:hypothetical protein BHM03_00012064, partial [Ensete ventricosum]
MVRVLHSFDWKTERRDSKDLTASLQEMERLPARGDRSRRRDDVKAKKPDPSIYITALK